MDFESLQQRINYFFIDEDLLKVAFTHRSMGVLSYERLEFLGDNILGMVISEHLYTTYPHLKEGKLSRMRSHLVRSGSLLAISEQLRLHCYVLVKRPNSKGQSSTLPDSLRADIVESLIGAIYLDSDYDTVRALVLQWFDDMFRHLNPGDRFKDPKTNLQEYLQSQGRSLPVYDLESIDESDNHKIFHVKCEVASYSLVSRSHGVNKKGAQQLAAKKMLKMIKHDTASNKED